MPTSAYIICLLYFPQIVAAYPPVFCSSVRLKYTLIDNSKTTESSTSTGFMGMMPVADGYNISVGRRVATQRFSSLTISSIAPRSVVCLVSALESSVVMILGSQRDETAASIRDYSAITETYPVQEILRRVIRPFVTGQNQKSRAICLCAPSGSSVHHYHIARSSPFLLVQLVFLRHSAVRSAMEYPSVPDHFASISHTNRK